MIIKLIFDVNWKLWITCNVFQTIDSLLNGKTFTNNKEQSTRILLLSMFNYDVYKWRIAFWPTLLPPPLFVRDHYNNGEKYSRLLRGSIDVQLQIINRRRQPWPSLCRLNLPLNSPRYNVISISYPLSWTHTQPNLSPPR